MVEDMQGNGSKPNSSSPTQPTHAHTHGNADANTNTNTNTNVDRLESRSVRHIESHRLASEATSLNTYGRIYGKTRHKRTNHDRTEHDVVNRIACDDYVGISSNRSKHAHTKQEQAGHLRVEQSHTHHLAHSGAHSWVAALIAICVVIAFCGSFWIIRGRFALSTVRIVNSRTATSDPLDNPVLQGPESTARSSAALRSTTDYDADGIDDYSDIVQGARMDAQAIPTYDDGYYTGGYPPADRGACTDLVWRAFKNAGYDLKAMVDADIADDPNTYTRVVTKPDPNVDFRRTGVLDAFFAKYGSHLTTDINDHQQWQQGDIVVFQSVKHIGIISDKRDGNDIPFVLHNMKQRQRENDYLSFQKHMTVSGHYRFDASQVPADVLRHWQDNG